MIFLFSLEKNIIRYKRIEYNFKPYATVYLLRFNPIMVDNYAASLIARRWVEHQTL